MKTIFWIFGLGFSLLPTMVAVAEPPGTAPLATTFTRRYAGEIDHQHKVRLTLSRNHNQLTGEYAYFRVGKSLALQGSLKGAEVRLEEFDNGRRTGSFEGRFVTPTVLSGTWQSENGKRMYDFRVQEVAPKPARGLTGNWSWVNQGATFELALIQRGNLVEGSYMAVTRNATRIDSDSAIQGPVRGNAANVKFVSGYGGNRGTARITRVGNSLRWVVLSEGVGGYYAPRRAILRRDR